MQSPCQSQSAVPGCEAWWEDMAWAARIFSKGRIDRAGSALAAMTEDEFLSLPETEFRGQLKQWAAHIQVLDNWRACHAYPLQVIKMTLLRRAKKIDPNALIAQRLKRRPSIEIKLRDNPHMKLSQMHDIGGCRAILSTIGNVLALVQKYKESQAKSPNAKDRSEWDGSDDFNYIERPKPDGYRSVHLVFRFRSASHDRAVYNGQRIEIQIRTRLQHSWATAVETAQLFTGQALKSKVKRASDDWLRFFALTSSLFAMHESCAPVPNTPNGKDNIIVELGEINRRSGIMQSLFDWNQTVHMLEKQIHPDAYFYLLTLDLANRSLNVQSFRRDEAFTSQEAYNAAELQSEKKPSTQVVLVSVGDLNSLKTAYPNYYVDTQEFMDAVNAETHGALYDREREQIRG